MAQLQLWLMPTFPRCIFFKFQHMCLAHFTTQTHILRTSTTTRPRCNNLLHEIANWVMGLFVREFISGANIVDNAKASTCQCVSLLFIENLSHSHYSFVVLIVTSIWSKAHHQIYLLLRSKGYTIKHTPSYVSPAILWSLSTLCWGIWNTRVLCCIYGCKLLNLYN